MSNVRIMSNDNKIYILVLEGSNKKKTLNAQFNPEEISFDKSVNWSGDNAGVGTDYPILMFTTGNAVTMNIELLFDRYEETNQDVRPIVRSFISLCMIDPKLHRPPRVQLRWGKSEDVLGLGKAFSGVIDKANAKYTMFTSDGVPCRATVSVSIKQADEVTFQPINADTSVSVRMDFTSPSQMDSTPGGRDAVLAKGVDPTKAENFPIKDALVGI